MFQLSVQNMTCGGCVRSVTRAVQTIDADAKVQVDLASGKVAIEGSGQPAEYANVLAQAGFPAAFVPRPAGGARAGCCCG